MAVVAACSSSAAKPAAAPAASGEVCGQSQATLAANPALASLINQAIKEGGQVSWAGGLQDAQEKAVVASFQKVYPCITKVTYSRQVDSDDRTRQAREMAAGQYQYDIIRLSSDTGEQFVQSGYVDKVDWSPFKVDSSQLGPNGEISLEGTLKVIVWNYNLVPDDQAPKNWQDVLDPKWKGKFAIDTEVHFLQDLYNAWGEDKVLQYATQLAANKPQFRASEDDILPLLAAGEIPIEVGAQSDTLATYIAKGAPLHYAVPDPAPVDPHWEIVTSHAPHPASAELLLGWLATVGQPTYLKDTGGRGVVSGPNADPSILSAIEGKSLSVATIESAAAETAMTPKIQAVLGVKE